MLKLESLLTVALRCYQLQLHYAQDVANKSENMRP